MSFFLDRGRELTNLRLNRRKFLGLGALAAASEILPRAAIAAVRNFPATERSLAFYHTHTGESLKATYWVRGEYVADALSGIHHILRDYRTDEIKAIDVRLLNLLHAIAGRLGTRENEKGDIVLFGWSVEFKGTSNPQHDLGALSISSRP